MKILITVKNISSEHKWTEEIDTEKTECLYYSEEGQTPEYYGNFVIDYFNKTLRPREIKRVLVNAKQLWVLDNTKEIKDN